MSKKAHIVDGEVQWDSVLQQSKVALYQTLKGPIMGLQTSETERHVCLYAPAMLVAPTADKVVFMPVMFVENFILLYKNSLFGTNPAPEVVIKGYMDYVKRFAEEAFQMKPLEIAAGVDVPTERSDEK